MDWVPIKSGPNPQTERTSRSSEEITVHGPAVVHKREWFSALKEAVGSTHGANETQHGNRLDLDIAQSLNQALLVQAWIFIKRCTNFFLVQSNDESNHQGHSLFKHSWRVEQFAFH